MRLIATILTVAFFMVSFGNAQEMNLPLEKINKVALEALSTFGKLINKDNYKDMGFSSVDEVSKAKLGEPIQVFMVQLDRLKKYQPGSDPVTLLSGGDRAIFPVMVKDQVRSSIVVEKVGEEWKATNFGGPTLVKMLSQARKNNVLSYEMPANSFYAVQVPALSLYYVGHMKDDVMMLTPLLDAPGVETGVPTSAKSVFELILPDAKEHDDLPR